MNINNFTHIDFSTATVSLISLIGIYLAFRLKQVALDYILQNNWMVIGKSGPKNWLLPLMVHTCLHGLGTLAIALIFNPSYWWLALVDILIHTIIDRSKVIIMRPHNKTPKDAAYWWAHGLDQEAHNLTHFAFVLILLLG